MYTARGLLLIFLPEPENGQRNYELALTVKKIIYEDSARGTR